MSIKKIIIWFTMLLLGTTSLGLIQNTYAADEIDALGQLLGGDNGNTNNNDNLNLNNDGTDGTDEFTDNAVNDDEGITNINVKLDNDNYNKTFSNISEKFAFLGVQNIFHVTKLLGIFNCLQDIGSGTVNGVKGKWVIFNSNCKIKGHLINTQPINT